MGILTELAQVYALRTAAHLLELFQQHDKDALKIFVGPYISDVYNMFIGSTSIVTFAFFLPRKDF